MNILVGIISRQISIIYQIPPGTPEIWPLNCPKAELADSALQVEYPSPKNVIITIEFTTYTTGLFCVVSLALLSFKFIILTKHHCMTTPTKFGLNDMPFNIVVALSNIEILGKPV